MKTIRKILFLCGIFLVTGFSCSDKTPLSDQCISGKIVGQKCNVFALQLDQKVLGATDWQKRTPNGDIISYDNVIGLINLPDEFRLENKRLFVTLRKLTIEEENNIPCYHDWPGPPRPSYDVLSANDTKCPETDK